jgi:outer membrane protein OmpA-like peptidoglycan-associated protein
MKFTKTIVSCLLALGCFTANAQEKQEQIVNEFNPHWYVQIQPLGAQHTLGEISFNDLLSYNFQIGGGYNCTPVWRARFSVNAWQSRAGLEKMSGATYDWKWNYVALMVDGTMNLSNFFFGYKPERFFNLSALLGVGLNVAWHNDEAHDVKTVLLNGSTTGYNQNLDHLWDGTKCRLAARVGLMGDFRIDENLSLGLELQANTVNDHYNSKRAGNSDWYFNGLVGLKWNFGKTNTTKTVPAPAPVERVIERVVERVVEVPAKPAETPVVVEKAVKREPLRRDVFFTINSRTITATEMVKVEEIADYLKKNPDAKVTISGYADKGTGNKAINDRLSTQRANTVADVLVKKFGIDKSRIVTIAKGDSEQPYSTPTLNRVSICIAE